MKEIYLIRHSKPLKSNNFNYIDKLSDQEKNEKIPLCVEGEELAFKMASNLFGKEISNVYASTYTRAISTAKYVAELNGIPINVSSLFNERKLGNIQNVEETFWLEQLHNEDAKTNNGESRKEVCERMLKGLNMVLNDTAEDRKVVIVSHATAITFLLMNWCELVDASLVGKKRWLKYRNKDVINDSFKTPEIFKLLFENNNLIDIERISLIS